MGYKKPDITEKFRNFILTNNLFDHNHNLLAAVSGGIDSVVMLHLLCMLGYKPAVAHCNFNLRNKESDHDQLFTENLAAKLGLGIFIKSFNTTEFARRNKISTEMAARQLRYDWFNQLAAEKGFDKILVAHNKDDNAETVLLNLSRGTGIHGMAGMKPVSDNIIRPLLFATRNMIETFAHDNNIGYCIDKTNADLKYKRNYIRHRLLPDMKKINPSIIETLNQQAGIMQQTALLVDEFIDQIKSRIAEKSDNKIVFNLSSYTNHPALTTIIFYLIKPYGFNPTQAGNISREIEQMTGKLFSSTYYTLYIDRKKIIIVEKKNQIETEIYIPPDGSIDFPVMLEFSGQFFKNFSQVELAPEVLNADMDKLKFPLKLRKWKKGDFFYPFGSNNKKKLSDFFIDHKIQLAEKKNIWLLESDGQIVWITGIRADNRFRITESTRKIWKCRLLK